MSTVVTCSAPVNIALVKYWGKRDEDLILPINSSLSVTLDQRDLRTVTSVGVCVEGDGTRMWLNGSEVDAVGGRIGTVLKQLKKRAGKENVGIHIASVNNFPTAAGLASSAAGLACLVFTVATALGVKEAYPGELTALARRGSGSACRSLDGGFVKWNMGMASNGEDSIAEQIVDESHWPELRILVCVVNDRKKDTSSTNGMKNSVKTSSLLAYRAASVVPRRMEEMETAILARDFAAVASLTMRDSNQFHATCLDTDPPIFYLNETSKAIISAVHRYNAAVGDVRVAYTFDAGPNAVLLTQEDDFDDLLTLMMCCFPPQMDAPEKRGKAIVGRETTPTEAKSTAVRNVIASMGNTHENEVRYFIRTRSGPGPQLLGPEHHLLNPNTLQPTSSS